MAPISMAGSNEQLHCVLAAMLWLFLQGSVLPLSCSMHCTKFHVIAAVPRCVL